MHTIYDDVEQGSTEWHALRAGMPTASMFKTVMAKGKGGGDSKTRTKYLYQVAAERITGEAAETFAGNAHTERGKLLEPEARNLYSFLKDADPRQVAFVKNEIAGASPDSLIGDDGMLEIKTKLPDLIVECIISNDFPPEHKAQCQGGLWVCEREWIDLAVYWPKLPLFVIRAYRDEAYIASMVKAIREFNEELDSVVAKLRQYEEAA